MKGLRKILAVILVATVLSSVPVSLPWINYEYAQAAAAALNKTNITLYIGNSYSLSVQSTTQQIKWSSDNLSVATVSSKGVVTAAKKGTAVITAQVGTKKFYCNVTVKSYSISAKTLKMEVNSKEKLSIIGAAEKVIWASSNKTAAQVDSYGLVSAKAEGTAKITGKYKNITYTCYVTVLGSKLHVSDTELTISDETSVKVTVDDLHKDEAVDFEIENPDIINCELGDWSGNKVPLTITPIKSGTTKVILTTNYKEEKVTVNVTVTTGKVLKTSKLSAEEVYDKCSPSTVQINTDIALGSGFFIDQNKVVTNYHVIDGAKSIQIQLQNGDTYDVEYIVGYSKELDMAILSIPVKKQPLILNQHGVKNGETVYTIGSSLGLTDTFTNGIVTSVSRIIDNVNYIQTNAAITNGNSGGPLLNAYGEAIGINTMQYVNGQNLNFAINIDQLKNMDTSKPMKAADFYQLDSGTETDTSTDKIIYEDETKSGDKKTCQTITSGASVGGVAQSTTIDYYKFTLYSAADVVIGAAPLSEALTDMKNMYVAIINSNDYVQAAASIEYINGQPLLIIDQILPAGTYYIAVLPVSRNTAYDIPYLFVYTAE